MINYLCTSPKPIIEGTDAVYNEMSLLNKEFGANLISLNPLKKPSSKYPVKLLGLHAARTIKKLENKTKLNHVYGSGLFSLPILSMLKNPVVYTVVASIVDQKTLPSKKFLNSLSKIVVNNERDYAYLHDYGLRNLSLITTFVNVEKFRNQSIALEKPFKILFASAPWELKQFDTKGIRVILETIQNLKDVSLTCLWRGVLPDKMSMLIKEYGLSDKVNLINEKVYVNEYLDRHHATILISKDSKIVKSYPHSILESICSAKPVIISKSIPVSDLVAQKNLGVVIDRINKEDLGGSITTLIDNYKFYSQSAKDQTNYLFSPQKFISEHLKLYDDLIASK